MSGALDAHLKTGLTSVCRCWKITRRDGVALGFTDHDEDLSFGDVIFKAGSGLSPTAIATATGLSVDNSEALGALDGDVLSEDAIASGDFDGAEVVAFLVNWRDVAAREVQFRGFLGEIQRSGGHFRAEVRGLSEALNQSRGRVFQKPCAARLGDEQCGFDTSSEGFQADAVVEEILSDSQLRISLSDHHADQWFERGIATFERVETSASIKRDEALGGERLVTFWHSLRVPLLVGDAVKLTAGCDRRAETCRNKFSNISNFRGFPDIPGEDWVLRMPSTGQIHDGGSRR